MHLLVRVRACACASACVCACACVCVCEYKCMYGKGYVWNAITIMILETIIICCVAEG